MVEYIEHYGTPRHSGRYPWGSGDDPYQRNSSFLAYVDDLTKSGVSEKEIASGLGMSTTELRQRKAVAKNEKRKEDSLRAMKLKEKGYSNAAIAEELGVSGESYVRTLLKPSENQRKDVITTTKDNLADILKEHPYVDVGAGVENHLGVSRDKLATAVSMLQDDGYKLQYLKVEQLGTGEQTTIKVLTRGDVTWKELNNHQADIYTIASVQNSDGSISKLGLEKPTDISSKRIKAVYGDEGGSAKDGLIELRPGVEDISLGRNKYAQVRISVDGTHYIKGMAVYNDKLPDGVDILVNTNKKKGTPLTGDKDSTVLKLQSDDPDNPFGAVVRQRKYIGKDGKEHLSAINIVNDEEDWEKWSKTLSSQMLSKQSSVLAKKQLGLAYSAKQAEFDEIMALTNPVIKKKLLESFADDCDAAASHLKAAALPRQKTHVIIPIPSLKDNEIYAPNYNNGENVVLIRYPHGGIFEIPELKVNNKNKDAKKLLGAAVNAVGINANVAARLSGADFDGDTVLVIPNNTGAIKTSRALKDLEGYDPKERYPAYPGMKRVKDDSRFNTQMEMGKVSNLITDMTIRNATQSEIARAVRHSMTVIDAEKHNLDWESSYRDNGIAQLKKKYQGVNANGSLKGASTLISSAKSELRVPQRELRKLSEGGPVDPKTGKKVWVETGATYTDKKGKVIQKTSTIKKMDATDDAYSLSSGTKIEAVYADHANRLKALANTARKEQYATKSIPWDPQAKKVYSEEVSSLKAKLNMAYKSKPLERKAQLIANTVVKEKKAANPNMDYEHLKKIKGQALTTARARVGAKKYRIDISPREWEAIQAGAISNNFLEQIISNADLKQVKALATPRAENGLTAAQISRMRTMQASGKTQSEIASVLGVSTSTVNKTLVNT